MSIKFGFPLSTVNAVSRFFKLLPFIILAVAVAYILFTLKSCSVFGPTKEDLKVQVKEKTQVIQILEDNGKKQEQVMKVTEEAKDTTLAAVSNTYKGQKKVVEDKKKRDDNLKAKIEEIDKQFPAETATAESIKIQTDKISTEQISSVWDSYCAAQPMVSSCKT